MSLLTAQNLGHAHGAFDVFTGLSLNIPDNARIGVVGPNGIGKTTLLRILAGVHPPGTGSVSRARDLRLGYLRQEAVEAFAARDHSIYAEMLTVFASLQEQAARLLELEACMAESSEIDALFAEYGALQEAYERGGGYDYEVRIAKVLQGLGFPKPMWEMPLSQLSGGQKTRALLARLLLEAPDLLLLDEPTNHLDMQAVEWLESTLRAWPGALLVVSHDRYFLDNIVDRVWEMSRTHLEIFRGNYSAYLNQRQERWERRQLLYEETRERLDKELELVRRFIGWRKMTEAKGKLRLLSRELVAIKEVGIEALQGMSWSETGLGGIRPMTVEEATRAIKEVRPPVSRPPVLSLRLRTEKRSGNIVLRTQRLRVGYPSKALFNADDIELMRQDVAALIGPNGSGKTTFLRTVLGELQPLAGEVRLGASLHVGYFAQAHDSLDPDKSVLDELLSRREMTLQEAREHLAHYLFRGEDVFKLVRALSGGERGRLALAILALDGANFLLLDEPTNHLDIPAQEVLQEGLERFDGTLLLVSHDRYLVDRLATQIWELREGRLHVFKGTYREFLAARDRERLERKEATLPVAKQSTSERANGMALSQKQARKRVQALAQIEARIAEAEAQLAEWGRRLQENGEAQRFTELADASDAYNSTQARLEALLADWSLLAAES